MVLKTQHYLIKPKPTLIHELVSHKPNNAWNDFLTRVSVWQVEEGGYISMSLDDYTSMRKTMMKVIFLVYLLNASKVMLEKQADATLNNLIDKLLGKPNYTVEAFDKWWDIERVALGPEFEYVFKLVPLEVFEQIESDDPVIQKWLTDVVKIKAALGK